MADTSWFDALPDSGAPAAAAPPAAAGGGSDAANVTAFDTKEHAENAWKANNLDPTNFDLKEVNGGWGYVPKGNGNGGSASSGKGSWFDDLPDAPQTAAMAAQKDDKSAPSVSSLASNVGAGANEQIAAGLGMPVDLMTGALNLVPRGINAAAGTNLPTIQNPIGGSESIRQAMGLVGANPENVPANNAAERVARGVGAGIGAVPTMALGAAGVASALPGTMAARVGSAIARAPAAATVAASAVGGGTGKIAAENVPEPYKPLADILGNVAGGSAAVLGGTGLTRLLGGPVNYLKNYLAPLTASGQQRIAGQQILAGSSDPAALASKLANNDGELVPGSSPTTFEVTGDAGIGQQTRWAQNQNPQAFKARRDQQSQARNAAVEGLAPEGDPGSVGAHFRAQLEALDQAGAAAEGAVGDAVKGRTEALGGRASPQAAGADMRASVDAANKAAKARESALWNAINPDGKAGLDVSEFKSHVRGITHEIDPVAEQPSGREAGIVQTIGQMSDLSSLKSIRALRSRISDAISREIREGGTTESPVVRRLMQYKTALDDALEAAIERQHQGEQEAVRAGTLAPEDTFEAKLLADTQAWQNAADARARTNVGEGSNGNSAGGRASSVSRASGAKGAAGRGSPNPAGNQGLQGETRNLTQDELARYKEARAATAERKQTFRSGPVGDVLAPGQREGFRLSDAQVGPKIFRPGPQGAESVQAYLKAGGSRDALADHAVASLRSEEIIKPDGLIDAKRFATWQRRYKGALGEVPELQAKFSDAARAQDALDEITATRAQATRIYETSAAKNFLKDDPLVAVGKAFGSGNSAETFGKLVDMVRGSPEAQAGLKRAVVEFIQDKMRNASSDIFKPEAFQKFIARNKVALRKLFGGQGLNNLEMVAADIRRSQQIEGTRMPGQSGTPQDIVAHEKAGGGAMGAAKHAIQYVIPVIAEQLGEHLGGFGLEGAVSAGIGVVVHAMRAAGLRTVDALRTEAMLNPDLARELIAKVPPKATETFWRRLASRIIATVPATTLEASSQKANP